MTKDEVVEAARSAGLQNPKLIPLRKLTQEVVWRLWYGPDTNRLNIELPRDPDAEHVTNLINQRKVA